jgi:hypothetical protein
VAERKIKIFIISLASRDARLFFVKKMEKTIPINKMSLREIGIAYIIETSGGLDYPLLSDHFGASDTEINQVVTILTENK